MRTPSVLPHAVGASNSSTSSTCSRNNFSVSNRPRGGYPKAQASFGKSIGSIVFQSTENIAP